ncbi:hypothetical protein [Agarivorans sp. Z349TD_8]|uniref:hypothetical protein n=1 Tax=Agarivorans sp. Z349TD_8 TaxID=3421434 RepID=UPI003D7CD8F3
MPFAVTRIQCNRCDCCTHSKEVNAWRVYLHHGLAIPLRKTLGWCQQCNHLVNAEKFRDIDAIVEDMASLVQQVSILEQTLKTNYWQRLFNRKLRQTRRNRVEMLLTLAAELDMSKQHAYRAKCENCGSLDLNTISSSINITKHYWLHHDEPAIATGLIHPACGGEFIATPAFTSRLSINSPHKISNKQSGIGFV